MIDIRFAALILAAGRGTRMRSALPKVMHALGGRPMIAHLRATVQALAPAKTVVVVGPQMEAVVEAAAPAIGILQQPPLGTGHAVQAAMPALKGFDGDVLILFGDTPLVGAETLSAMLGKRRQGAAVVVLGFRPADPGEYGRLVVDAGGNLQRIVEHKDASAEERRNGLCNSGCMAVAGKALAELIWKLENKNAKGEFYLTDIVALARANRLPCSYVEATEDELLGINSRAELAAAETIVQRGLRAAAMEAGATLLDPDSTYFSFDTKLGRDVVVEPNVYFGPGVTVGDRVRIHAFSHFAGCRIADGAEIGPFARLRPGADLGPDVHIGNFVEVKNATIEAGAKANHLSYLGDARVGAGTNVGAGTITCNYDGFGKYHTDIGAGAFIGSNTALVAPVKVGDNAIIGAGSTISRDVPDGALSVTRPEQETLEGGAERFRAKARVRAAKAKQPAASKPAPARRKG
ncbi:MAG TPA: bifunctional UDP-N-acetylglucosamine diphosphorylase/glucosamine-1-phosphate N-acetyltransferase GlmU [Candidatus Cybelea sp.]|nr:bifunctional UDP-N-acetylglucosamine diphosphorylase/glucosamine-1-phosphate N-acetyltransferase GlmU [Candidatus Cybelea sp.]